MSDNQQVATSTRKRQQIDSANKQIYIWVGFAAFALSLAVVLAINLYNVIVYQGKVNDQLGSTAETVQKSFDAIGKAGASGDSAGCPVGTSSGTLIGALAKACNDPIWSKQNLVSLSDTSGNPVTHTPFQVVYDALPTDDDSAEIGAEITNVLGVSGVRIAALSQGDSASSAAVATASTGASGQATASVDSKTIVKPNPTAIPVNLTIAGSYSQLQAAFVALQNSIRPIVVNSITLTANSSGDGQDQLQAVLTLSIYYVDKSSYKLGSKEVEP